MAFKVLAVLSAVVAGVGLWRGDWLEAAPGVSGVMLSLLAMRASSLFSGSAAEVRRSLNALGGFPFSLGAVAATGSVGLSLVSLVVRNRLMMLTAAAFATLGFALLVIAALRFSTKAEDRKRTFFLLALLAAVNAIASTLLLSRAV